MVINVTSRLLLHIAAYIGVPLNNSALTSGLYTTNCNMLSTSNTKVGAFVLLYFLSFMAFGTQVFLGFPVPNSKCCDGSQHSKLPLHASHVALQT